MTEPEESITSLSILQPQSLADLDLGCRRTPGVVDGYEPEARDARGTVQWVSYWCGVITKETDLAAQAAEQGLDLQAAVAWVREQGGDPVPDTFR